MPHLRVLRWRTRVFYEDMCSVIGWSVMDDADWLVSFARSNSNWKRCFSSCRRCSSILFRSAKIWFCRVIVSSSVFQFWTDSVLKDSRFWDILVKRFSTLGDDRPESCVGFEVGGDWGSSVIVAPENGIINVHGPRKPSLIGRTSESVWKF